MLFVVQVLVLTYNHEAFIAQAISSIINQKTNFNFQIIISDDCSTDNTLAICKKESLLHPGIIKIIESPINIGMSANALKLFSCASSPFIAICEGDDYWTDLNKLQKQFDYMNSHDNCIISFHDVIVVDEAGSLLNVNKLGKDQIHFTMKDFAKGMAVSTRSVFYRNRPDLLKPFINEEIPFFDLTLYFRLLENGGVVSRIPEFMAAYRQHSGGVYSAKSYIKKCEDSLRFRIEVEKYYKNSIYKKEFNQKINSCYLLLAEAYFQRRFFVKGSKVILGCLKNIKYGTLYFKEYLYPIRGILRGIFYKID